MVWGGGGGGGGEVGKENDLFFHGTRTMRRLMPHNDNFKLAVSLPETVMRYLLLLMSLRRVRTVGRLICHVTSGNSSSWSSFHNRYRLTASVPQAIPLELERTIKSRTNVSGFVSSVCGYIPKRRLKTSYMFENNRQNSFWRVWCVRLISNRLSWISYHIFYAEI